MTTTTNTQEHTMNTIQIPAADLQTTDVIIVKHSRSDETLLRNVVTSAPRKLGGSGKVQFGLTRDGRTWDGRLPADYMLTVER